MKVKWIVVILLVALADTHCTRAAVIFDSLFSFDSSTTGANPHCTLIQSADGNLYGTTVLGGPNYWGSVFKMSPDGQLKTLVWFDGTNGAEPWAGLVQAADGYLYGTTRTGGTNAGSMGTIFRIDTNGDLVTLFTFAGTNGYSPNGLIQGTDGRFYGTTAANLTADNNPAYGTVFEIDSHGVLTTLAYFNGTNGGLPQGELTEDSDGNFYGTTEEGGEHNGGTIFRVTTNGILTTLFSFGGTNGGLPMCGLTKGVDGSLYGVTQVGGSDDMGTVFKITTDGKFTLLHSFSGLNYDQAPDGDQPVSKLVRGDDGNFYGTTSAGGANGFGTIFKITADGDLTTLYSFGSIINSNGHPLDGYNPNALMIGKDGDFYGTTYNGGTNNNIANNGDGAVFRLSIPMPPMFKKITQTNGFCSLIWSAVAGQVYQLQFATNLNSPDWIDLGDTNMAVSGVMSATDNTGSAPQRFYRVVLP